MAPDGTWTWPRSLTSVRGLLLTLWAIDLTFVILHLAHVRTGVPADLAFHLGQERGHAELFQYAKMLVVCATVVLLWSRTKQWVLMAWACLFAYLTADDAFELHERAGAALAPHLGVGTLGGLQAQDIGELLYIVTFGVVWLPLLAWAHFGATGTSRQISRGLWALLALWLCFAVGLDFLHAALRSARFGHLAGMLEDAGELFVMSVILCYLVQQVMAARYPSPPLARTDPARPAGT